MRTKLEEFILKHGLEQVRSSPITARSYVNMPGIECETVEEYHWPKRHNGTRYDQTIYLFVYHDGSFSIALELQTLSRQLPDKGVMTAFDLALNPE